MGKDKLRKFRENETFACFVQPEFDSVFGVDHPLKGHWRSDFFHNDHPIVLELGCGKGEYTVALAERDPSRNYIGIDIKGNCRPCRITDRLPVESIKLHAGYFIYSAGKQHLQLFNRRIT